MKTILCLIIALLLLSCTKSDKTKIEVEPVLNHKLEIVDSLIYLSNDNLFLGQIRSVKIIKDKMYLSDISSSNIKVFDKKFNWIASIGRYGEGPGEFTIAPNLSIKDDTLFAFVYNRKEIHKIYNNEYKNKIFIKAERFIAPESPVFINNKILFSSNSDITYMKDKITHIYSNMIATNDGKEFKRIAKYSEKYYGNNMDKKYYAAGGANTQISEGFNKSFVIHQNSTLDYMLYDTNGNLVKTYFYKPKYYKNPPDISKHYQFKNKDEEYEKFYSKTTYYNSIYYDTKNHLLVVNYLTFGSASSHSKQDDQHYLFAFNEQGECLFDEPIPSYLADVADGYIYIVTEESPERFVMLKCQLVKKIKREK